MRTPPDYNLRTVLRVSALVIAAIMSPGCSDGVVETSTTALTADDEENSDEKSEVSQTNADAGMNWEHSEFGKTADGKTIEEYVLRNSHGTLVKLINYGATVVSVET